MSIDRWMDKEDVVHIYNGILLSHKKEWNNAICSNVDATRDYHTDWSKTERERPYDITYMWNLKHDTNEPSMKQKQNHRHREQMVAKEVGGGRGMEWTIQVSRCKLLYIEWIHKVLQYSTENYIQYPMINHNGKEYFKNEYIYRFFSIFFSIIVYYKYWI